MRVRRYLQIVWATGTMASFGLGCRAPATSEQPTSELPASGEVARSRVAGIEMRSELDAWDGPLDVEDISTPVAIEIVNRSGEPLYIGPSTFQIVDGQGRAYEVLPLWPPQPTTVEPADVEPSYRVGEDIQAEGFYVDPRYAHLYPELDAYELSLEDLEGETLMVVPPPRPDEPSGAMLRTAIPRGVLVDGGRLAGFLFFEPVDFGAGPALLEARFLNPADRTQIATLDLGFSPGA